MIKSSSIAERMKKAETDIHNTNPSSKETKNESKIQKNNTPLLFVDGRLNRKDNEYIAKNFSLLKPMADEINIYCKGIDLAVINALIHKGLEAIKKDNSFSMIEYSDIESQYKNLPT